MLLKDSALTRDVSLDPSLIIIDFELPMTQAAALNFLSSYYCGCSYHIMQAIWRKVPALGLVLECKDSNSGLKGFVQKLAV